MGIAHFYFGVRRLVHKKATFMKMKNTIMDHMNIFMRKIIDLVPKRQTGTSYNCP